MLLCFSLWLLILHLLHFYTIIFVLDSVVLLFEVPSKPSDSRCTGPLVGIIFCYSGQTGAYLLRDEIYLLWEGSGIVN